MSTTRRGFLLLAGSSIAAAGLSACAPSPSDGRTQSPPLPTPATTDVDLESVFSSAFATTGMAGCAIRVRHDGEVWRSAAGVADRVSGEPYSADGYVRIASITKTYTATVILQMVDDGMLQLEDALERHLPGIPNGDVITVRQLLAMQSGIFDFTADERFLQAFTADPTMAWSLRDTIDVITRNQPLFAPGENVSYCDSNYALLGAIAEQLDGAPLHEIVEGRVATPLGLADTYYPTETVIRTPHPTPYVPELTADGAFDTSVASRVVAELNPAVPAGAGAMVSTLEDLSAWGDALAEGTLLSAETQRERLETKRFTGQELDFGYGLGITNLNEYLGHDGAIFGFSSVVLTRPRTGTQIAVVGNESTNFTTPTLTIAVAIINAIDPSQGTNP